MSEPQSIHDLPWDELIDKAKQVRAEVDNLSAKLAKVTAQRDEAMEIIRIINAEWLSSPSSTACFNRRIIERACILFSKLNGEEKA